MTADRPDPAPRSYPSSVSLLRRAQGGPSVAPATTRISAIESWLIDEALGEKDLLALFESLAWRLVAAGLPLDRASLHVGTLHPQLFGFAWNWNRDDGLCDEVQVAEAVLLTDAYKRNPLFRVIEYGEAFHVSTTESEAVNRFPLLKELAQQGITEYAAVPLRSGSTYHNAVTIATRQHNGFSKQQQKELNRVLRLLALHVERHITWRIAQNVLDTYLGSAVGERILRGAIKRGTGESIQAIIWASDLRGFTDLTDRLSGSDMIVLLNAYFERLVEAVVAHGGQVLKFIGDGLLAVFPHSDFDDETQAAEASLAAAKQAVDALARLNDVVPQELAHIEGWRPLKTGIALHEGGVFFGNIGASQRLDFTVIGSAVNATSRVETLTKSLRRSILITEPVARLLSHPLDPLGAHKLRGLEEAVAIFSPPDASFDRD